MSGKEDVRTDDNRQDRWVKEEKEQRKRSLAGNEDQLAILNLEGAEQRQSISAL